MVLSRATVILSIILNKPVASDTECYVRVKIGGVYTERYVTIAAGGAEVTANFSGNTTSTEFTVIISGCDEIVIPSPGSSGQIVRTLS